MKKQRFRLRPFLFWPHLVVGLAAGIVVFVLSLTGALLAFERPILSYADNQAMANVESGPTRLPLSELIASVEAQAGQPVTSITVPAGNGQPVAFEAGRGRIFLADRSSGRIIGPAAPGLRAFFQQVTAFHRWFGLTNAAHKTVLLVKGWCTLAFVFLIISGWYLWLPPAPWLSASWKRAALRIRLRPGWAATARAREFNWHHAFGFWCSIPLAAVALTGVIMALPWANQLLFRATGSPLPPAREGKQTEARGDLRSAPAGRGEGARSHSAGLHSAALLPDYDHILEVASRQQSGWKTLQIRIPAGDSRTVPVIVDRGNGAQPQRRDTLLFDAGGNLQRTQLFRQQSLGQQSRMVVRFLHTGEIFGFAGELIGLLGCLAGMLLVYTGIALSTRRFTRKTAR
jgi:uncharacterized iron-regulated membrane protein